MRLLFVEVQQAVHSVGYLRTLLHEAAGHPELKIAFAHTDRHDYLGSLLTEIDFPSNVLRFTIKEKPCRLPGRIANFWLALVAILQLRTIIEQCKPDRVIFLRIDFVLPWLWAPLAKWIFRSTQVYGIYFGGAEFRALPTVRWKHRIRHVFDRGLIRFGLKQKNLGAIFLLDHSLTTVLRNAAPNWTSKIQPSVDPWQPFPLRNEKQARESLGLRSELPILLSLGVHSGRKGTVQLLKSLALLPLGEFHLVIAGPLRPDVSEKIIELAKQRRKQGWSVTIVDRFIDDGETWDFLQAARLVVCPYINFLQSSNVMIRACAAGKPVVVCKGGVMEDAVKRFGCGIAVDTTPSAIAQGIQEAFVSLRENPQAFISGCKDYAALHTSKKFLEQFL